MTEIYIDVTNMMSQTFITGIQRVVREGTKYLIENQERWGYRVRLLRWIEKEHAYQILDNEKYLGWLRNNGVIEICNSGQMLLPEQIHSGAVFFDIDSVWPNQPHRSYLHTILKHRGVKIAVLIHDVIPITHPQFTSIGIYNEFPQYLDAELAYADLVFTTSQFVAKEIKSLLSQMRRPSPRFEIAPLGSDFVACRKSDPNIDKEVKEIARSAPYLLTVASIEPRKNHKVILDAYDQYLKNTNINIIFAGRKGWNVDLLLRRLYEHPLYNKRIFHFEGKNNETISYLYQKAMYTVFPTFIEGFGLPAVESLIANTPALLSDIPVMREIAGGYAQYFAPDDPKQLADLVLDGLANPSEYQERKNALSLYCPTTWTDFGENLVRGLKTL